MKRLLFAMLLAVVTSAQTNVSRFSVYDETTLASAARAITVQQPSSGGKIVEFESGTFYCSVACTITLEVNGSAASATAASIAALRTGATASATAWTASNVGTGTTVHKYVLAAAGQISIDLNGVQMSGNSTTSNLSLRVNSISGDIKWSIKWREF